MELVPPFDQARIESVAQGTLIVHPESGGDDYAWLVVDGVVRQYQVQADGTEFTLNLYKPGSLLSITWIFGGIPNRYFYSADTQLKVAKLDVSEYRKWVADNPRTALFLLEKVSKGLDGYFTRMAVNSAHSAQAKIINEIKIFQERMESDSGSHMTVQKLAQRTGLARETASRTVSKLIAEGVLRKIGNHIELVDH